MAVNSTRSNVTNKSLITNWEGMMAELFQLGKLSLIFDQSTVRDITWMSANGLHLCKWTLALALVTLNDIM